ncbi:hypothetical protein QF034_000672 [Streptomyces africanus]|uniref:Uncharacterized protein n=1 Tax=Streptomyces africanus TaxID=231024 RepID=A0ABU0QGD1_9ACTN|nr:hypothetical protein [Streptomyces africanus]
MAERGLGFAADNSATSRVTGTPSTTAIENSVSTMGLPAPCAGFESTCFAGLACPANSARDKRR